MTRSLPLRRLLALLGLALLGSGAARAQPFDPGPPGTPVGSSMSGAVIPGAPRVRTPLAIPNAPVFGDTVEERQYGRDYDNSYLKPRIPRPDADGTSTRLRAREGDPAIGPDRAGDFARSDGSVINKSGVTRPLTPPRRARIVPNAGAR
ncbi:hypothetical protein [Aureimonas ureilytica]|uniref:hypothetical protein n=1 Tax=Aureimonas ureilytica TaxID=401562 RepID=UPI00036726A1|nr:hypothetical protein [Aureimonas ureilytica]